MPDKNKLDMLREAQYKIRPTCGRCEHFDGDPHGWGRCKVLPYTHGKHTKPMLAGVLADGSCPKFEMAWDKQIGPIYMEFWDEHRDGSEDRGSQAEGA